MVESASSRVEQRALCFAPVINPQVRVLVLGSLPGQTSLARGEYYAHPRNQFWKLMGGIIGQPLHTFSYPDKLACLLRHHIGLWDSIAHAHRPGSLDAAISAAEVNDLADLIARLPLLRLLAFNGQTAERIGRKALTRLAAPDAVILPSSSPAHTLGFPKKLALWQAALAPYIS